MVHNDFPTQKCPLCGSTVIRNPGEPLWAHIPTRWVSAPDGASPADISFAVTDDMKAVMGDIGKRLDALIDKLMRDYYKTYETWLIDGPDFAPAHEAAARRARLPSLITGEKAE